MKTLAAAGLLVCLAAGLATGAAAMVNPEGIQWKATPLVFVTSVYQAALGRDPTFPELSALADLDLNNRNNRWNVFWRVIGSAAYQDRFGNLPRVYSVYWTTRTIDTQTGRRPCHCYAAAESPNGYMPALQYTGYPYPAGRFTFPVAMALVTLYAGSDPEACPHYDCGFRGEGASSGGPGPGAGAGPGRGVGPGPAPGAVAVQNLVRDWQFAGFGQQAGAWGTGQYSGNGLWWNSGGARSSARAVVLPEDQRPPSGAATALHITNASSRGPNVFGTTAQRISVSYGRSYEVRLQAAARNLASNSGVLIAVDPQWRIRPLRLQGGSYGWTEFSGVFTAETSYIDLRIIAEDMGEVRITDVRLIPR